MATPKNTKTTKAKKNTKTTKAKKNTKTTKTTKNTKKPKAKTGKTLVIVEAPGKIEKMKKILGDKYIVTSSRGHIMDLPVGNIAVDFDNRYEPSYVFDDPKLDSRTRSTRTKTRKEILTLASKADKVLIASDKDREGEMIGWSYEQLLGESNLDRICFGSITEKAVKEAMKDVGKLDMKMVESQQARRIIDRIAGYKLSSAVTQFMGIGNVSVGRVQSVLVRLICDKEKEIEKFFDSENASYFKYNAEFKCGKGNDVILKCNGFKVNNDKYTKYDSPNYKDAKKHMTQLSKSKFNICEVIEREVNSAPPLPFNTSTCMQSASSELHFNAKKTMMVLQKLYEKGYTTYLRTDSMEISEEGHKQVKKYIEKKHPGMYKQRAIKKKKGVKLQEGHEAIRPSKISKKSIASCKDVTADESNLYNLIWRRTVASQMTNAKLASFDIYIGATKSDILFKDTITQIVEPGYKTVYSASTKNYDKTVIPTESSKVTKKEIKCSEDYKKPPARYNEQSLVKIMDPDHLNIGRPATTSSLINTIKTKKYVEIKNVDGFEKDSRMFVLKKELKEESNVIKLGKESNRFCPTNIGTQLVTVLIEHFPTLMDYEFTANMEKDLDDVANGSKTRYEVINTFWKTIEPSITKLRTANRGKVIGKHPDFDVDITTREGKHGPVVEMNHEGRHYIGSVPSTDVSLEVALASLPIYLGDAKYSKKSKEHPIFIKHNQYGYYIEHFKRRAQLEDDCVRSKINLEIALELLDNKEKEVQRKKKERVANYMFYEEEGTKEYIIDTGKYGKYILVRPSKGGKGKFFNIPDDTDTTNLTLDNVKVLMQESLERKKRYWNSKKTNKRK
jgi:DNA topoisomerase-1